MNENPDHEKWLEQHDRMIADQNLWLERHQKAMDEADKRAERTDRRLDRAIRLAVEDARRQRERNREHDESVARLERALAAFLERSGNGKQH